MGQIITVSIFKGGTGKTTSAVNLSASLAQLGRRVLLVDLDQQASATKHLGIDPERINPNLFHVFLRQVPASLAVQRTEFGFDIIPGNGLLAAIEESLEEGDEAILSEILAGQKDAYDFVIIDSPPSKSMLSRSSLAGADQVLIPLQAERPALDGVQDMLRFIQEIIWPKYNPNLKIAGILPTMLKRSTTHSAGVVQRAREIWGDKVFSIEIPESIAFPRSYDHGVPINFFDPEHEGSLTYLRLAQIIHEKG